MGIFGYIAKSEVNEIVSKAIEKVNERRRSNILSSINAESLDRAKANVDLWREALEEWEGIGGGVPDRYKMMQLYAEIVQDDSVATHLTTIQRSIEGTEFQVGVLNGDKIEPNEAFMDLFRSEWYSTLIRYVIEAEMFGYTLIDVLPAVNGQYESDNFKLIPRHLVIPEQSLVRKRTSVNIDLINYKDPAFASRLMELGDKYSKGLFNNIALMYIYKKNALAYWSNYQSKFGIPPVIVKTDLSNNAKTNSLISFLQNMRSNTFSLVGYDDQVEILNNVDSDAFNTFKELIDHCDKQISKVLEGQTMTSSDGSSRSQAEVHERVAEEFHQARLRRVERTINKILIPILSQDIKGLNNVVFRYAEKKNVDDIIDRVVKLKQAGYQVEKDYLEEVTGLVLEKVESPIPNNEDPKKKEEEKEEMKSIMREVESLYSELL